MTDLFTGWASGGGYGMQQTVTGAVGVTAPLGRATPPGMHAPATTFAPTIFADAGLV